MTPVRAALLIACSVGWPALGCSAKGSSPDSGQLSDAGGGDGGPTGGDAGPGDGGADGGNAGMACQSNSQCSSALCGTGDGGNCCAAACPATSSDCQAVGCDAQGGCLYPSQVKSCGSVCDAGVWTRSSCDGRGGCAVDLAVQCPGRLACNAEGNGCRASCAAAADCAAGFYCRANACIPRQRVGFCDGDDACGSGQCIGSACCAAACSVDPSCGAYACGLDSGVCLYPDTTTPCGPPAARSCDAANLTSAFCSGEGSCGPVASQTCQAGLSCSAEARACYADCSDGGAVACASGRVCDGRSCCPAAAPNSTPGGRRQRRGRQRLLWPRR